ncbi:MAG: hypothetical protein WA160_05220 [Pseudobdellovibrio sp.]
MNSIKKNTSIKILNNQSGFIIADFIFAFTLVLCCGIIIFALTFSLATVEISQYIVWSTARNYSAANQNEPAANLQAKSKFNNLADHFPLLTGRGSTSSSWFTLDDLVVGDLAAGSDSDFSGRAGSDKENKAGDGEKRQPWIGARANLEFKLLAGIRIPFLGSIASKGDKNFKFPIRAFVLRHPSQDECYDFFKSSKRFSEGIQKLETQMNSVGNSSYYVRMEDNGC